MAETRSQQDVHQRAKERYQDARDAVHEQHLRMQEDLRFSNPADPQQWDAEAQRLRKGRVCLTLDRTNQFIVQVINDARKNKPGIGTLPADSGADIEVAKRLDGIIRHIEYRSRAAIAYDTAVELAARCGLGWLRVVPEVTRPETNEQEIVIRRVHDPLSIVLDPDSTEPDGSDAAYGFAETTMSRRAFQAQWPKADPSNWDGTHVDGQWYTQDAVRVCEYQYVEESRASRLSIVLPDGEAREIGEDEYWSQARALGYQPRVLRQYEATQRTVHWCKLSGAEVLETTVFPSRWLGFIPVLGFELWVDGRRYLCGLTRRLMDSQRAYNYERTAFVESVALQPKAPIMTPVEAVAGHEKHWERLNSGSPAYLPFNAFDDNGQPVPLPQRLAPPAFPVAFAQGGQLAVADMEAAVGMYRANLGAPSNETSGRAIRERKEEGDTATYHFVDNLSRSIEQLGRIVVEMIPTVYDTRRQARILGIDGQHGQVTIDPKLPGAVQRDGRSGKVTAINPGVGSYDVRVVAGANYTTQRQEAAAELTDVIRGADPQTGAVLLPMLLKLRDMPEADKYSRMLLAMLPPPVQQIGNEGHEGEDEPLPPRVAAMVQQMQQQAEQMQAMLDAGEQELARLEAENGQLKADREADLAKAQADAQAKQGELQIKAFEAETDRLRAMREAQQPEPVEAPATTEPAAVAPAMPAAPAITIAMPMVDAALAPILESQQAMREALDGLQQAVAALADASAAPRAITIQRDADGRPAGAVSVPIH